MRMRVSWLKTHGLTPGSDLLFCVVMYIPIQHQFGNLCQEGGGGGEGGAGIKLLPRPYM